MYRKISHITFSFLLLVSTIGLVVSKHYCGDEIVSVSVFQEEEPCCDMGDCCSTESQTFQVKDDFSTPAITVLPLLAEIEILGHDLFGTEEVLNSEEDNSETFVADSPPPKTIQTVLSLKQLYLL